MLRAQDQSPIPPENRAKAHLTIGVLTVGSLFTRHLRGDVEFERLTVSLETDGSKRAFTNNEHRINVVVAIRGPITGVRTDSGTFTSPVQHLGNNHEAEAVDGADLTRQDRTS